VRELPSLRTITNNIPTKGPDEQLEKQVLRDLSFLFTNSGASVVSNRWLPGIGNSELIVEVKHLRFRFIQGWGSLQVSVAPSHTPEGWRELTVMLMAVRTEVDFTSKPEFGSLAEQAAWLRQDLDRLDEACSQERFAGTVLKAKEAWKVGFVVWGHPPSYRPSFGVRCLRIFARLIIPPFKVFAWIYRLVFPRKKDRLEPIGSDETFVEKVREDLSFLFAERGARITSSGYYWSFGNACLAVDAGNLRIRAIRDRGFVSYDFAALVLPWLWNPIDRGVMAMNMKDNKIPPSPSLWSIRRLTEYFDELSEACSVERFPQTRRNLELIRDDSRKKYYDSLKRGQQVLHREKLNDSLHLRS
jgi:hypothetical protein